MVRRKVLRKKLKKLFPAVTATLTTIPFAVWAPSADAFFPPIWGISPPVVVAAPSSPPAIIVVPPVSPPPFVPPPPPPVIIIQPPSSPPPVIVVPVGQPNGVPEPGTLISGLVGLAAAAGYQLKRRNVAHHESNPL
jgi:hypothetical protein